MRRGAGLTGEFRFIEKIAKSIKTGPSVLNGIGDDCAVLKYKKNKHLLFTTDMIVEGVHFIKESASARSVGYKALAVNISDIAACGGIPRWAVISAGIPKETSGSYAAGIFKGINNIAQKFNIDIVGGDTNLSSRLVLSIALLGEVLKGEIVTRSGAREGDLLVVTGPICENPQHLSFIPKIKESQYIVKNLMPNAMIDISDGFLSDLEHILKKSQKGAILYESLIPVKGKKSSIIRVLNTGEQFQLIFTMPKNMLTSMPKSFYVVGEISGAKPVITFVECSGRRKKIHSKGYRHF
jgi:thiamine-monophosphate kinase